MLRMHALCTNNRELLSTNLSFVLICHAHIERQACTVEYRVQTHHTHPIWRCAGEKRRQHSIRFVWLALATTPPLQRIDYLLFPAIISMVNVAEEVPCRCTRRRKTAMICVLLSLLCRAGCELTRYNWTWPTTGTLCPHTRQTTQTLTTVPLD